MGGRGGSYDESSMMITVVFNDDERDARQNITFKSKSAKLRNHFLVKRRAKIKAGVEQESKTSLL